MTQLVESTLDRRIIPGIAAYVSNPAPADTGERSLWAAGKCWLACAREDLPVRWLGPVAIHQAIAPMRACEECIGRLTALADLIALGAPGAPRLLPAVVGAPARPLVDVTLPLRAALSSGRGERPQPPVPDDGNLWVEGFCWLYCDRSGLLVLPIGSTSTSSSTVTMYACARCITYLDNLVWGHLYALDGGTASSRRQPVGLPGTASRPALAPAPECENRPGSTERPPQSAPRGRHRRRPQRRLADHLGTPVRTSLARLRSRRRAHRRGVLP
ncbi:hypothetical protein ACIA8O_00665 [Kitasatospora sp. NPDC051853]|uniref:hypothetical protein n=1 Tax=Kitasatospora sp. NPDC051853 TaxID=3364058 RepID=UPI00379281E7